uniref:50S ribosomal protein L11, chloroplastic n=1 Tax=Climaconeis sp. TaxID=2846830 RepID=A0A8F8X7C0_9STRA|nr:ribosomal protein L11 [Climaconeis sp.]
MPKKITALIKLALLAGKATPSPPIGPALGQHGVNIAAFCKEYNARTIDNTGLIIPVEISVYEDRSYTFILKTPPASVLLASEAKTKDKKGSAIPNRVNVGSITKAQLEKIALIKLPDLNTTKLESAKKIIEGTARNMGITIID